MIRPGMLTADPTPWRTNNAPLMLGRKRGTIPEAVCRHIANPSLTAKGMLS
ncbi:MAG: hypothetical protein LKH33_01335 [Acetobacter sp.]|nr:hypothetical protein [Acetobacter sp.]MCH4062303.1 hypothetical protein [Acetobacter sp.]MCH4088850.1 hypothetical protein [Acetobacter sp.]MCI1292753.1 hypothetical protein [Acetobacter sp.]MCI1372472.1 hypothetical protein [Acetobacter sp.]